MGRKLYTVIFDHRLVSEDQVARTALAAGEDLIRQAMKETAFLKLERLPGVSAWGLQFVEPHDSGMQMLFSVSLNSYENALLPTSRIAQELSRRIPDVPFIYLGYTSVVGTGWCEVWKNGEEIQTTESKEGDDAKNINPVFKKYFGLRAPAFSKVTDYLDEALLSNGFRAGSYPHLKYEYERDADELFVQEYKWLLEFLNDPSNPKADGENFLQKMAYEDYLAYQKNPDAIRCYALTEGNGFSKDGCWLLKEPKRILPEEYFSMKDKARDDLEARKTEKFGERPKSYRLTAEELQHLSYEEQKKEAYRRREIAKKRLDAQGTGDGYYAWGIAVKCDYQEGQYVRSGQDVFRVKRVLLVPDPDHQAYTERIEAYRKLPDESAYQVANLKPSDVELVGEDEVLQEQRVPDNYI